jgi:hypothetical protein
MIGIREYLSIIGELSSTFEMSEEKIIADLITLDTIATHFLQSGIQDLGDSNSRMDFMRIVDKALEVDLLRQLFLELLKREDLLPGVLKEFSLISDTELLKLLTILKQKHPNKFVIVTITLPEEQVITKYMNTYTHSVKYSKQLSELDTLLSLYMEVNSGA